MISRMILSMSKSISLRWMNSNQTLNTKNDANEMNQLLPKKLIEYDISNNRECLHAKRYTRCNRTRQTIARFKDRIGVYHARIRIDIDHDIVDGEREIEEEKVDIVSDDSKSELQLTSAHRIRALFARRGHFNGGAFVLEYLVDHEQVTDDHDGKRYIGTQENRYDI